MTREEIAAKIRWSWIIWTFGFVNVAAMLPQLYEILKNQSVQGLSIWMFVIYFLVQVAFALEGFFKRNTMLMTCLGLSACISATIISFFFFF